MTTETHGTVTLHHGDCLDVLREMPDASVDACVTDPPYLLGFMGREWDTKAAHEHLDWHSAWSLEAFRVLKPGGHLLAFGGTRTSHRLACAIEDAGFEIRDSIAWLYGSGFPKSLDVSKAIDKAAGAEREVVGYRKNLNRTAARGDAGAFHSSEGGMFREDRDMFADTAPATDDARTWQGWGTALKPAHEPIVVARKPLAGTVSQNVLAHGTGALNIDGCRVEGDPDPHHVKTAGQGNGLRAASGLPGGTGTVAPPHPSGRWPANVVLDESQAEVLDEQSGVLTSGALRPYTEQHDNASSFQMQRDKTYTSEADSGGASRFFFIAREDNESCPSTSAASTAASPSSHPSESADSAPSGAATTACPGGEKLTDSPCTSGTPSASRPSDESGTPPTASTESESSRDWQPAKPSQKVSPARYAASLTPTDTTMTTTSHSTSDGSVDPTTSSTTPNSVPGVPLDGLGSRFTYVAKADAGERVRVNGTAHPTVKPLALMRWLVRLVTPPGGTVLEPFAGSGTTVEACLLEGFDCIAIEREADYLPLIHQRINRRRDPVEAVKAIGDDGGLFDLLGGEPA